MAYDKKKLEKQALAAIREHNLMFITDVPAYLPCATSTFYALELEKSEEIKELMEENRIKVKNGLRAKWYKSENATVQIALYKLIGTDDEVHRLSGTRQEISGPGGKPIQTEVIDYKKLSDDALREIIAAAEPGGGEG
jgi:hypothetical protein